MTPLVSQLWPQFMADPDFAACFGRVVVEHAQMLRQERQVIFTLRSSAPLDKGLCARLLAFSNGDLQALFDRSDGFYRRQLVLTTKEKPAGRVDDPDLAEKMKAEAEGILLWAFEGLQRLAANNFKFTESDRTRENREAVKRDNNNVYDFLDSDGYVRLKADLSASSKELYEAYQIYCTENNLPALKPRSFSEALIACQSRYNLEYCNNVTNAAGRRVRGFLGIEVLVRNHISVFSGDSMRTYVPEDVPEEWRR